MILSQTYLAKLRMPVAQWWHVVQMVRAFPRMIVCQFNPALG